MWWVKIGIVAARQANVSRKVALPLPGVGVSSRRRKSRRADGVIGSREVPFTVATAEAPMRNESSGLSTLMRIGKARGETDPVERALDARQSIDACAVLRQHGPTEPNDSAAEMLAGLRLQINITGAPAGMCRSCVSRKLATTYQVRVSTKVNTSTPARAKAPLDIFMLTTRPVNGARTVQ